MKNLKVWYPATLQKIEPFAGTMVTSRTYLAIKEGAAGHIVEDTRTLCGKPLNEAHYTKLDRALLTHPLCRNCEKVYREREDLPYAKWVGKVSGPRKYERT